MASARADEIVLKNGDRLEGRIVSETADAVQIEMTFKQGDIRYTRTVERAKIAKVSKSETSATANPATGPKEDDDEDEPAPAERLTAQDRQGLLDQALQRWGKQEYATAANLLSRAINGASPAELDRYSAKVETEEELTLGDLLAECRLLGAIERTGGRAFRLSRVTEFEKPYLVPRLTNLYERCLDFRVDTSQGEEARRARVRELISASSTSRPAKDDADDTDPAGEKETDADTPRHNRRDRTARADDAEQPEAARRGQRRGPPGSPPTDARPGTDNAPRPDRKKLQDDDDDAKPTAVLQIAPWLSKPDAFDVEPAAAKAFVPHLQFTLSVLSERIRQDPQLKKDTAARGELTRERSELQKLYKVVVARAGGALTADEKEQLAQQEREQMERMRREQMTEEEVRARALRRLLGVDPPPGQPGHERREKDDDEEDDDGKEHGKE